MEIDAGNAKVRDFPGIPVNSREFPGKSREIFSSREKPVKNLGSPGKSQEQTLIGSSLDSLSVDLGMSAFCMVWPLSGKRRLRATRLSYRRSETRFGQTNEKSLI